MPLNYVQTDYFVCYPNQYRQGEVIYRRVFFDKDSPRDCYVLAKDCFETMPTPGKLVGESREWDTNHVLSYIQNKTMRQLRAQCKEGYHPIACIRNPITGSVFHVNEFEGRCVNVEETANKICALFERHPFVLNNMTCAQVQRKFAQSLCVLGGLLQDSRTVEHKLAGLVHYEIIFNQDAFDFAIWLYPKLLEKMGEKNLAFTGLNDYRECILFFYTLCIADKALHEVSYTNKSHAILFCWLMNVDGMQPMAEALKKYDIMNVKHHNDMEAALLGLFDWVIPVREYAYKFDLDSNERAGVALRPS